VHEVLTEVDDNIRWLLAIPQGIFDWQLRPFPIHILNKLLLRTILPKGINDLPLVKTSADCLAFL
jgi:hypothetical protein